MTKNVLEYVVGLVFLVAVLTLGAYTILISGLRFGGVKYYVVDFEQVYGLRVGDPVRVEGHEKGEVRSIRLLPEGDVRAVLEVADDVEIYREGSDVRVTPFSPLGGRVVEIERGKRESPRGKFKALDELPDEEDLDELQQVEVDLIEGQAEGELLQTLNALVEENKQAVKRIVDNIEHVSRQLTKTDNILGYLVNDADGAAKLRGVADGLSSSAQRLDRILTRVEAGEGVVGGLLEDQSELHRDFEGAVDAGRESLESLSSILARADRGHSAVGALVTEDRELSRDVRGIVTDVKHVTGEVSAGRGTLGKLVKDERLYEGAATTAENLSSITKKVDEGKGLLGVLLEDEAGNDARETLDHLASITRAVDDPEAGTVGLLIHDDVLRGRISRIATDVERLVVEFRDSLEDLREQAPVNAFVGAVFAAF